MPGPVKYFRKKRIAEVISDLLRMHMSSDFSDACGHTPTVSGATISTSNYKFSTGSGFFNGDGTSAGSGQYVSFANSSDWNFGSSDFTIEMFVYPTASVAGNYYTLVSRRDSPGVNEMLNFALAGTEKFWFRYVDSTGTAYTATELQSGNAIALNTWSHIALCRSGANLRLFVNGVQQGTTHNIGARSLYPSTAPLLVGLSNTAAAARWSFAGYMDEIRISRIARYTSNFSVPDTPF